ncbi:MAG: glycosyltransferase [Candidatus Brocadiia bacterium]
MRILAFISNVPWTTGAYYVRALRSDGHRVTVVSPSPGPEVDAARTGIFSAVEVMNRVAPDAEAAIFFESGARAFPADIGEMPCPTAWYAIDTHMHLGMHRRLARLFDVTFVAQKEYVEALRPNCPQCHWLPLAADARLFAGDALPPEYGVAFVGSLDPRIHRERCRLLRRIAERYPPTFIAGNCYLQEMADAYRKSRIVFNQAVRNDLNMRVFEGMAAGALMVTDAIQRNGLENLFTAGEHLVTYASEAELFERLDYYLAHEPERRAIAERGRALVLRRDTYEQRARQLTQTLGAAQQGRRMERKARLATLWSACRLAAGVRGIAWLPKALSLRSKAEGRR